MGRKKSTSNGTKGNFPIQVRKANFIRNARKLHCDENRNPLFDYSRVEYYWEKDNIPEILEKELLQKPDLHCNPSFDTLANEDHS